MLSALLDQCAVVPVESIAFDLLVIVVGGVGLLVVIPDRLVSETAVDRGSGVAILVLIYSSIASVEVGAINAAGFGAVSTVVLLLFGGGFALVRFASHVAGVDRSTYLPLFFTGGLKNLGIALVIAFTRRRRSSWWSSRTTSSNSSSARSSRTSRERRTGLDVIPVTGTARTERTAGCVFLHLSWDRVRVSTCVPRKQRGSRPRPVRAIPSTSRSLAESRNPPHRSIEASKRPM